MEIVKANESHIKAIITIAYDSWQDTYKSIISQEQISYMLQLFYNENILQEQMQNPEHHFWVAMRNEGLAGYAHCIDDKADADILKLSKLYVLPREHGRGVGRSLLSFIENECDALKKSTIALNVNRHNPAKDFYLKQGFEIVQQVDIPLDKYWLNDYIMQKKLHV